MLRVVVFIVTVALISVTTILTRSVPRQTLKYDNDGTRISSHADGVKIRRMGVSKPIFDPLVAKMERLSEEERREARVQKQVLDAKENELYYEDGRMKIRLRLMVLFPMIDVAPKDNYVDYSEFEAWILGRAIDNMNYRTRIQLQERDKDGDSLISFQESLPHVTLQDIEKNINNTEHGEVGWWLEQFKNADSDHSGTLNLYEYRDFLHPEDTRNGRIQKWFLNQKIRRWDGDGDEQLNLDEFERGAYESYKNYFEYETGDQALTPNFIFSELDSNKDRLLRAEELRPIVQYLNPGELTYAKHYTRHLINEADENGDGKLTLGEMLNHESVFYNTVHNNERHDSYHDEL